MLKSQRALYKIVWLLLVVGFSLLQTVSSAQMVTQADTLLPLAGLTVVCDLDYTFLDHDSLEEAARSQSRNWLQQKMRNFFVPHTPVVGMVETLKLLQSRGATIQFVSARKHSQYEFLRKTLDELQFQNAKLQLAEYIPHGGESMYKYEHIGFIIKSNPHQRYFLIGDNQDRDPKVFDRLASEAGTREKIIGTFIRQVRRSDPRVPRRKDLFTDGFHWAEILTQAGFISAYDLEGILSIGQPHLCRALFAD